MNKKQMIIILVCAVGVLLIITWFGFTKNSSFDGYIVWGPEMVIFTTDIKFRPDNTIEYTDSAWVNQNEAVKQVYNEALIVKPGSEDTRVIKIKFKGIKKDGGNYGHLGKYSSEVTVEKIIEYSLPSR